ncbi:anti-sigma factor family protein [Macrococcus sp. EM39E]|uniref:anti-sigma factor family protein n=1 Tax=Macrococcus animalis TaxID=3395467 RepID=UPI0039BEA818
MNHSVFKDLLLNYIDGLTSDETNAIMEEHMRECESCKNIYHHLKEEAISEDTSVYSHDNQEFDAFKKVKKSHNKKIIWSVLGTLFIASLLFGLYTYLYSTQWITNSNDVKVVVKAEGNKRIIHIKAKNNKHFVVPSEEIYVKSKGTREYIIYEARKGNYAPELIKNGINLPVNFVNQNTIINRDNQKEKIDDKDEVVLRFKDKKVKMKLLDLYQSKSK